MNLRSRLEALEQATRGGGDIRLIMADGTERTIPLGRAEDALLVLFRRIINSPDSEETRLIRSAVEIQEPGGSRMLELAIAGFLTDPDINLDEIETGGTIQ